MLLTGGFDAAYQQDAGFLVFPLAPPPRPFILILGFDCAELLNSALSAEMQNVTS